MNKRFIIIASLLLATGHLYAIHSDAGHIDAIYQVLNNYKREATILEIGKGASEYTLELPDNHTRIALLVQGGAPQLINKIKKRQIHSITVLAPDTLTVKALEILGRCEHFDVVIVHDISSIVQDTSPCLINALIKLGEYVFMRADSQSLEEALRDTDHIRQVVQRTDDTAPLFLSHCPKPGIDLSQYRKARKYPPSEKGFRYKLESTFSHKYFLKDRDNPLPWIHGINLVTFVMLQGVYPTDESIKKWFLSFEETYPYHNDLVLGNVIVRGDKLDPIDFEDLRRYANLSNCIHAAVQAFNKNDRHNTDPNEWIADYYTYVHNH